jgi:MFS family permease
MATEKLLRGLVLLLVLAYAAFAGGKAFGWYFRRWHDTYPCPELNRRWRRFVLAWVVFLAGSLALIWLHNRFPWPNWLWYSALAAIIADAIWIYVLAFKMGAVDS